MFRTVNALGLLLAFGCLAPAADKEIDETKLVAQLEKAGAKVTKDDAKLKLSFSKWEPAKMAFLKASSLVHEVTIEDASRVADGSMALLASLPNLEKLELFRPAITPAGLLAFKTHTNLKSLVLMDARVGDAGIVPLKEIATLEELDLSGTLITSQAAATLKLLPNLKVLTVTKTKFTGRGALQLKDMPQLKELNAINCDFTEKEAIELEGHIKGIKIKR